MCCVSALIALTIKPNRPFCRPEEVPRDARVSAVVRVDHIMHNQDHVDLVSGRVEVDLEFVPGIDDLAFVSGPVVDGVGMGLRVTLDGHVLP